MEAGRNESIKRVVMAGLGISLISANTITALVEKERLEVLDLASTPLVRHWYLMRPQKRKLILASLSFWKFLEKTCRNSILKL